MDRSVWIFNRKLQYSVSASVFRAKFSCFHNLGCDDFMVPVVGEYQVSLKYEPDFISLIVLCFFWEELARIEQRLSSKHIYIYKKLF